MENTSVNRESTFPVGCTVLVSDHYVEFEGVYLGDTATGLARVLDPDTGDVLVGDPDYVEMVA